VLSATRDSRIQVEENRVTFAPTGPPGPETIARIGEGWVAEEALAIALYCTLCYRNHFEKAVLPAVNHGGDSDSTGAITGNIMGALLEDRAIPREWRKGRNWRAVSKRWPGGYLSGRDVGSDQVPLSGTTR